MKRPARALPSPGRRSAVIRIGRALAAAVAPVGAASPLMVGPSAAATDPPFRDFYDLSRLVTARGRLDPVAARKLYRLFVGEPWGVEHIASTFGLLRSALLDRAAGAESMATMLRGERLPEAERWFAAHLLTTWYLGVYYHERRTERVLYAEALMWEAVRGLTNVLTLHGGEFGFWSEPPPRAREPAE